MSRTLSNPENASPLVRSQSEVDLDDRGAAVAPRVGVEANPPVAFGRVKTYTSLPSLKNFDEHSPQLSERDSIFATTYFATESNAATPRQQPSTDSKNDRIRHVASELQLPPSVLSVGGPPSSLSPQTQPSSTMTSLLTEANQSQWTKSNKTGVGQRKRDGEVLSLSQRHDSETFPNSGYLDVRPHKSSLGASNRRPHHMFTSKTSYNLRMPSPKSLSKENSHGSIADSRRAGFTKLHSESADGNTDNVSKTTYAQRDDQPIEAILASDEPAPHGRSRKASHYLGIFKEKVSLRDPKKSMENRREIMEVDKEPGTMNLWEGKDMGYGDMGEVFYHRKQDYGMNRHNRDGELSNEQGEEPIEPTRLTRSSTQSTTATPSLFSKQSTLTAESEGDTTPPERDRIEWRSGNQAPGSFPLRLLEEIRSHRKEKTLKAPLEDSSKDHNTPDSGPEGLSKRDALIRSTQPASYNKSEVHLEDEEGESDKERISSATYYPHQAPSPDTVAEHLQHGQGQLAKEELELTHLPPQTIDLHVEESQVIHESGNSAFNLQSKDRIQYIQREYRHTPPLSESLERRDPRWSVVSSASDTEYESADDISRSDKDSEVERTDNGDITPTATPNANSFLKSRRRHGRKPLRAVELQPYKHQVGGHTKVFSFSKQAICKELNNRENVFYEVIERNHPQLLQFLPR